MAQEVNNWLGIFSKKGYNADLNDELERRIVFSNIVFISMPIVYIIFILIDYKTYFYSKSILKFDQFVVPIIIVICFICLWLNKIKLTILSRNIFLTFWPLFLQIIPIKLLYSPSDYLIAFPIGIIFHSILIQLMLSNRKEPVQYWFWMILNFITIVLTPEILSYFAKSHSTLKTIVSDNYYRYDCILYWLLFNLVIFYIILELERNIQNIKNSNLLIEKQKDELNILNENLEKIVSERTFELEEQNKKIRNHAFYNAHLLRGPFCRVQGLINVQELVNNSEAESLMLKSKLKDSLDELDKRIHEIQLIVQEDGTGYDLNKK